MDKWISGSLRASETIYFQGQKSILSYNGGFYYYYYHYCLLPITIQHELHNMLEGKVTWTYHEESSYGLTHDGPLFFLVL